MRQNNWTTVLLAALVMGYMLISTATLQADDYVWTNGAGTQNWTDPGNWKTGSDNGSWTNPSDEYPDGAGARAYIARDGEQRVILDTSGTVELGQLGFQHPDHPEDGVEDGTLDIASGTLILNDVVEMGVEGTTSTINQSGGRLKSGDRTRLSLGHEEGATGRYEISGGEFHLDEVHSTNDGTGVFSVVGSSASITIGREDTGARWLQGDGTLKFRIDEGGVSTIKIQAGNRGWKSSGKVRFAEGALLDVGFREGVSASYGDTFELMTWERDRVSHTGHLTLSEPELWKMHWETGGSDTEGGRLSVMYTGSSADTGRLVEVVTDDSREEWVRSTALEAIREGGEHVDEIADRPGMLEAFAGTVVEDPSLQMREEAAQVLLQADPAAARKVLPRLQKQLEEPEHRVDAIEVLVTLGTDGAMEKLRQGIERLVSEMRHEDPGVRWTAARQLKEMPAVDRDVAEKLNLDEAWNMAKQVRTDVETLYTTFEDRRDEVFEAYRGTDLEIALKRRPLSNKRPLYTRHYARSVLELAITAMMNNENLDRANKQLDRYAEYYRDHRSARNDRDSFYWTTDLMTRIVEFFGRDGSIAAGRLDPEVEKKLLEVMWRYVKENSYVGEAENFDNASPAAVQPLSADASVWFMRMSENHHTQKFTTLWEFSNLLRKAPDYRDREYNDRHTAAEHYRAWTEYAKEFLRERAGRGMLVEMANSYYNVHTLKGIYNLYDFSTDPELRRNAGHFLTLYYARWAQEQINGVRGGGKSRIYKQWMKDGDSELREWMWFYLGIGEQPDLGKNQATVATSEYRMPKLVMDLALDLEGRGSYEIIDRTPGLAESEEYHQNPWLLRDDFGGRLRYAYATPDFVMGTPIQKPVSKEKWAAIGIYQLRMGVIFRGHLDDRIMPVHTGAGVNPQWGVQKKGTMITQRLTPPHSDDAGSMRVWFGGDGLTNGVERKGWLFVETQGAYAAVRPARGGYSLQADPEHLSDSWMDLEEDNSPVIIEVARKKRFDNYEAFQEAVLKLAGEWQGDTLYYNGLYGNEFVFYTEDKKVPEVDGEPVDLSPDMVYNSPFIQSTWNSDVVTISRGERKLELEFD